MTETKIPGIEKRTASFKVGKGFTWTGMKPDVESVDAEPNVSRQLINVRLRGGRIEGRGGQLLLASRGLPITGLADYFTEVIEMAEQDDGPGIAKLYFGGLVGGPPDGQDNYVARLWDSRTPSFMCPQYGAYNLKSRFPASNGSAVFYVAENDLTGYSKIARFNSIARDYASTGDSYLGSGDYLDHIVADVNAQQALYSIPVGPITDLSGSGKIFIAFQEEEIGTNLQTGNVLVYSWDGTTLVLDETFTAFELAAGGKFDGKPFFASREAIQLRGTDGTWTSFSIPSTHLLLGSNVATVASQQRSAELGGFAYILAKQNEFSGYYPTTGLWKFDGASLVFLEDCLPGVPIETNACIYSVCSDGSNLYYIWAVKDGYNATSMHIGKFDGTTWDPFFKDLLADFPSNDIIGWGVDVETRSNPTVIIHDGRLVATMQSSYTVPDSYVGTNSHIVQSPLVDYAGAWNEIFNFKDDCGWSLTYYSPATQIDDLASL